MLFMDLKVNMLKTFNYLIKNHCLVNSPTFQYEWVNYLIKNHCLLNSPAFRRFSLTMLPVSIFVIYLHSNTDLQFTFLSNYLIQLGNFGLQLQWIPTSCYLFIFHLSLCLHCFNLRIWGFTY